MHRRAIIALAVATLGLGTIAYAADSGSSDKMDRSGSVQTSGSSLGSDSTSSGDSSSVDRSVDTKKGSGMSSKHGIDRSMTTTSESRSVDEDENRGARTGGYLAAGIGIAALIGLFASRRSRASGYDSDVDDDFRSPGPRV